MHRLVVTEENFHLFRGEYDAVTHAPYRIGDVLLRCGHCGVRVREEYVAGVCPVCGAPFVSAPDRTVSGVRITPTRPVCNVRAARQEGSLWILSILMAAASLLPLLRWGDGLAGAFRWLGMGGVMGLTLTVSLVCALVVATDRDAIRWWKTRRQALWLLLIPLAAPYMFWLALWLLVQALALLWAFLKAVFIAILCIAIISALFGS